MGALPTIAPRLVVHAADVEDLFAGLAHEHAALRHELDELVLELDTAMALDAGLLFGDALQEAATAALDELGVTRRQTALAEVAAMVEAGERAAAGRVATAEAEASALLDAVRLEITERLLSEAEGGSPRVEPAVLASPTAVVRNLPPPDAPLVCSTTAPAGPDAHGPAVDTPAQSARSLEPADSTSEAGWDEAEVDTDRFRAFWSEHDQVASVREAIAAPLIAMAPMVLALLVIVLTLVLVI